MRKEPPLTEYEALLTHSFIRTAKVMNYTEMEQKVREATSNDPWGASGTLKQELAQATHNLYAYDVSAPAFAIEILIAQEVRYSHTIVQLLIH